MEIFGYTSAIFIGISLGLIGGGGSVLAVPILAYLFYYNEQESTAYSLFIVGTSSLVGGLSKHMNGLVDWRTAIVFGIPALVGVSLVRNFLVPILPNTIVSIHDFDLSRRMLMFGLFALLMIPAAISMLKESKPSYTKKQPTKYNYPIILAEGLIVGVITGLVGAGGGFLIIPALVVLAGLEMKIAVGTSLIIIAFKSILGFLFGDAFLLDINWLFLGTFTTLALIGILIGNYLSRFIQGKKLKKAFGYFIIIMAIFIIYQEFILTT